MTSINFASIIYDPPQGGYLYTYNCHETERELCELELRALFGRQPDSSAWLRSEQRIHAERSPFIGQRLDIEAEATSVEGILDYAAQLELGEASFKVIYLKSGDPFAYDEQRRLERLVGSHVRGRADMRSPERLLGLICLGGKWLFGSCTSTSAVRFTHKDKPRNYSTGLPAVMARALVNIAMPEITEGKEMLDPCCGMGNVLLEACSMGIPISGNDLNPLAVRGARENLAFYHYPAHVTLGDMNKLTGEYEAAVLDMPYNLCSVISDQEQMDMLRTLRRLSRRAVIVATMDMEAVLAQSGWEIKDQCHVRKGNFIRKIWLCE